MKKLSSNEQTAYLFSDRILRRYFTRIDIAEGYLIISGENLTYFTDARYFLPAKERLNGVGIECKLFRGLECLKEHLHGLGVSELKLDYRTTTMKEYGEYKEFGFNISDASCELELIRSVKSEIELDCIKKACDIIERAYHSAIKRAKKGMTELELKEILENFAFEFGAETMAFDTIVAFGENSAVPHHETGNTVLRENMPVLIDTGCTINGYCSDLTRTAFFGTPSEKFVNCYNAVRKANLLAIEKISAGISCFDADAIARNYLKENGLDKYFTHSLGHGVGLEIHEYPTVSPRSQAVLEENVVFTIEPGVYIDHEFGIRVEDTVVIKNGKVQRLFSDDKELIILKK